MINDKQAATLQALPWPGAMVGVLDNGVVIVAHPAHPVIFIDREGWAEAVAYGAPPGVKVTVTTSRGGGIFGA